VGYLVGKRLLQGGVELPAAVRRIHGAESTVFPNVRAAGGGSRDVGPGPCVVGTSEDDGCVEGRGLIDQRMRASDRRSGDGAEDGRVGQYERKGCGRRRDIGRRRWVADGVDDACGDVESAAGAGQLDGAADAGVQDDQKLGLVAIRSGYAALDGGIEGAGGSYGGVAEIEREETAGHDSSVDPETVEGECERKAGGLQAQASVQAGDLAVDGLQEEGTAVFRSLRTDPVAGVDECVWQFVGGAVEEEDGSLTGRGGEGRKCVGEVVKDQLGLQVWGGVALDIGDPGSGSGSGEGAWVWQ
jgi:hypothetical protein